MGHTQRDQEALPKRVRKLRGQVDSVERALLEKLPCSDVLHRDSACRGAVSSLLAEVLEGHVREHLVGDHESASRAQLEAADDALSVIRPYLK